MVVTEIPAEIVLLAQFDAPFSCWIHPTLT